MKDNKKYIKESELFDDRIITEGEDEEVSNADNLESEVTDEMIRIDSLKLANKVCRMIDSVSIEDMINVASMAERFLRDYVPGCDIEEILGLKSSSKEDESEKFLPAVVLISQVSLPTPNPPVIYPLKPAEKLLVSFTDEIFSIGVCTEKYSLFAIWLYSKPYS